MPEAPLPHGRHVKIFRAAPWPSRATLSPLTCYSGPGLSADPSHVRIAAWEGEKNRERVGALETLHPIRRMQTLHPTIRM
jgi:hypothetical protein